MDFKLILAVTILLAVPFVTESGNLLELIQTFIGRFYTKDALSVWTNLDKHL